MLHQNRNVVKTSARACKTKTLKNWEQLSCCKTDYQEWKDVIKNAWCVSEIDASNSGK